MTGRASGQRTDDDDGTDARTDERTEDDGTDARTDGRTTMTERTRRDEHDGMDTTGRTDDIYIYVYVHIYIYIYIFLYIYTYIYI